MNNENAGAVYAELFKVKYALVEQEILGRTRVIPKDTRRILYALGRKAIEDYENLPQDVKNGREFDIKGIEEMLNKIAPQN